MLLLPLVVLLAWGLAAEEDPSPGLSLELDDASFFGSIHGRKSFIAFFTPGCPHCPEMAATWEELADSMDDVFMAAVDCAKPQSSRTCALLEVTAFPTLKLIHNSIVFEHSGERDYASLKAFATEGYFRVKGAPLRRSLPGGLDDRHVVEVTDANISIVESSGKTAMLEFFAPWCSLCQQLVPAYNQLAAMLALEHPDIMAVKCDATVWTATARRYGVIGYPTLKVLHEGQVYNYAGNRDAESLLRFLLNPSGSPSSIPGAWDWKAQVIDSMEQLGRDVGVVVKHKQTAAIAIYIIGLLSGCIVVLLVALLLPHPEQRQRSKAASPIQERKDQ
eukprot:GGOE01015589.1.p1 GENE.GGOE01015589.1~~GGOE01015589.1.p1  ORF type:complete len:333 (+),score=117.91 GGOE01015589.1:2-1000(+)